MHLSPKERFGYAALGAMLLVGLGFVVTQRLRRPAPIELHETSRSIPASVTEPGVPRESTPKILVHVAGAVLHPGLVFIPAGSRVYEAIAAAGGPTADANADAINLAAKAVDGSQILVPHRGGVGDNLSSAPDLSHSPTSHPRTKHPASILDLNSATPDQLQTLPGIGAAMAQKIADYRSIHGPFQSVEDLQVVPGFGKRKLDQVRPWLIVQ